MPTLKVDLFSKHQEWKGSTIHYVDHRGGDGEGGTVPDIEVEFAAAREEDTTEMGSDNVKCITAILMLNTRSTTV